MCCASSLLHPDAVGGQGVSGSTEKHSKHHHQPSAVHPDQDNAGNSRADSLSEQLSRVQEDLEEAQDKIKDLDAR